MTKQAKTLTDSEFKRLLAVASQDRHAERNRIIIFLSFACGLRVSEITSLLISDAFTEDEKVKDEMLLKAKDTKTNEARRIFISKKLKKELETYIQHFKTMPSMGEPLVKSQSGKKFRANSLVMLFDKMYKDSGIPHASSHSGRRTFITKLAHSGISPKVIMTLAGHKNLQTTSRYIEINDEMLREAVEII